MNSVAVGNIRRHDHVDQSLGPVWAESSLATRTLPIRGAVQTPGALAVGDRDYRVPIKTAEMFAPSGLQVPSRLLSGEENHGYSPYNLAVLPDVLTGCEVLNTRLRQQVQLVPAAEFLATPADCAPGSAEPRVGNELWLALSESPGRRLTCRVVATLSVSV